MKFPAWLKTLPAAGFEFVSTDFSPFRSFVDADVPVVTAPRALAAAIGRIAWAEFQAGRARDPAEIDANYIRRSDAELNTSTVEQASGLLIHKPEACATCSYTTTLWAIL